MFKRVEAWDREGEHRILTQNEVASRNDAIGRIWSLNHREEVSWKHKSKMLCLKEGDKKTRFFHQLANVRWRINHIEKIRRDGRTFEGPEIIKEEIANFFANLYKKENVFRPKLDGVHFPLISFDC